MSKQWGNGYQVGQVDALKKAVEAFEHLQDREVYAMALVNKLMLSHHNKKLVEDTHQAIRKADRLWQLYVSGLWHGYGAGLFVETHPPMSKKMGTELLINEALKHGWKPKETNEK